MSQLVHMPFHLQRRQQFLGEVRYATERARLPSSIAYFAENPMGSGRDIFERDALARRQAATESYDLLALRYTAGEPIEPLRTELETVVAAYERYGEYLWKHTGDRNDWVFDFDDLDAYCELMQLVGLCFLLHRRDLLPRIAALQDGEGGTSNGGADTLYEEFMAFGIGPETRFETDRLCQMRPYENLFYGLTETMPAKALKEIDLFLKHWYKDLAGVGWHDSHKPNEAGDQGGYYGYWSFEAGAAVLLLGIEDDSSLHKYLYYPKDLVAWAKTNATLTATSEVDGLAALRLRCEAGQPCPRSGWWSTPAWENSRQRFEQGQTMPAVTSDYGTTIWQFEERQAG